MLEIDKPSRLASQDVGCRKLVVMGGSGVTRLVSTDLFGQRLAKVIGYCKQYVDTHLTQDMKMIAPKTLPNSDQGLSDEATQVCMNSLGWSVWALTKATEMMIFPVEDLATEIAMDPAYAGQAVEVYKMMAIERTLSSVREKIADEVLDRLRNALTQAKLLPAGDPSLLPIDYSKVGQCCGIHPDDIHCLRPDRR